MGPTPSKSSGTVAIVLDAFIYALGGEQIQGTFDGIEKYDFPKDLWNIDTPIPTARHGIEGCNF